MNILQTSADLSESDQRTISMQRVAVVENPASGQTSPRRKEIVRETLAALHQAGIETEHLIIDGPGRGSAIAREAIARGCDTILVCGGDGTVHEVLQALVAAAAPRGDVPMAPANALAPARGVRRPREKAARSRLRARPRRRANGLRGGPGDPEVGGQRVGGSHGNDAESD